jgi:hypothetical protein
MSQIRAVLPTAGHIVRETCGACFNFKPDDPDDPTCVNGRCQGTIWNNQKIQAGDPRCEEYMPAQ